MSECAIFYHLYRLYQVSLYDLSSTFLFYLYFIIKVLIKF